MRHTWEPQSRPAPHVSSSNWLWPCGPARELFVEARSPETEARQYSGSYAYIYTKKKKNLLFSGCCFFGGGLVGPDGGGL